MRKIKVKIVDNFRAQSGEKNHVLRYLRRWYDVELCDNPDYLLCSCFGHEHLKYDCVKIFFNPENLNPDFNAYDYVIGPNYLTYGDRYLRVPFYHFYPPGMYQCLCNQEKRRTETLETIDKEQLLNRGFCSFVVSNSCDGLFRQRFFKRLSKYRQVASGGRLFNNIGGPCADKQNFISKYKFNIAFENSAMPGYTTEKIVEPLVANAVPIYWGDPLICDEFNDNCMVRVKSVENVEDAIEKIIYLDTHDDEYINCVYSKKIVGATADDFDLQIEKFLKNIIDKPLPLAKRTINAGAQRVYREVMNRCYWCYDKYYQLMQVPRKIVSIFR